MDIDIIKVCSKNDFLYFLCELKEDFYTDYEHWQNENVGSYLEAIVAWLQVCERLDADDQKYIFSNMRLIDWNTALNIVLLAVGIPNDLLPPPSKSCIDDYNPKDFSRALQIRLDQLYDMNISLTRKVDDLLDNFIALLQRNEKINVSEVNPCVWMFLALILEAGKYYE